MPDQIPAATGAADDSATVPAAGGTLSAEDAKLVTLARGARARVGAIEGASVRDQDGRTYRSFQGLLAHLGTLTRNELRFAGAPATVPVLAEPTSEQRQAFELIGAAIPLTLRK